MNDPIKQEESISHKNAEKELATLYSKRIILIFSGLFSVIFGAALLLSNFRKLNEQKGIYQVLIFVVIYVTGLVYTISSMKTGANLSLPLNLAGGFILNEYFWNRYIGKETEYEKKSWVKPTIISLAISIPSFLALVYMS